MATPMYARYIPPKAKNTRGKASVSLPVPEISQAKEQPGKTKQQSKDQPKKRKRETKDPLKEKEDDVTIPSVLKASEVEEVPAKKEHRSKDRPKKRKREREEKSHDSEDNGTKLKKHKSVLSKFEKVSKIAGAARESAVDIPAEEIKESPTELHGLTPLPQPEPVPEPEYHPTFSALPPWLAKPTTVSSSAKVPFADLGLDARLVEQLEKKGYKEALAVQSAVIPMLLPGLHQHFGDICVSAATGSGKTLAYILPMIEGLQGRVLSKLSGLIVVPTRELVTQARVVAEQITVGTKIKVGTAVGNISFPAEQELLVKKDKRFDPEAARLLHDKANEQLRTGFVERGGIMGDLMHMPPGHVPHYESSVDILICTPGRLVEHIQSTTGFSLSDIRWLVVDEADRLLDDSFQEWVDVLMKALEVESTSEQALARRKIISRNPWLKPERQLTKVVLSATMTKDLSKLGSLKFRRPKMVIVENEDQNIHSCAPGTDMTGDGESFELPPALKEWAIPVGTGLDKPLYLLKLLQTNILSQWEMEKTDTPTVADVDTESSASSSSSSDSDNSDSDSASSVSDSSEDSSSEDESDDSGVDTKKKLSNPKHRSKITPKNQADISSRVLVFTNNNENAARLSHLLAILHPPLKNKLGTLTKSAATKSSQKTLAAFATGKIRILIASDRASRGLDVPDLGHIVNYDLPRSVTDYVHRVGRTARAGKEGQSWTFFTKTEGRWFWNDIARASAIRRAQKVDRAIVDAETLNEEKRTTYEAALRELRVAVEGSTGRAVGR
ncbi:P-loop containing nucleoside triphosphate hydrolase protein [Mytilinidion resinicola]|uniref:ATP-dependent RNA helicase n=1 Tax=Mytilinidion resinicola TaxID=574789 RepID=A0A6A6Z707_9PEZI|nr:P-loop containing nucleoside triphosphate hydrolase protein [Mytilinidion resinicola]KAF2816067.1 P-loop containing nucleoside triphosphate hydrolase protein [Mytilinidion resinicola]